MRKKASSLMLRTAPAPAPLVLVESPPDLLSRAVSPVELYLASLSPSGRATQARNLERAASVLGGDLRSLQWSRVRFAHVEIIRSKLSALDYAPALVNATLSAIRGVARRAWHLGEISAEDYQRVRDVRGLPATSTRRRPARALELQELEELLAACDRDQGPAGRRDAALVALLYGGGLRRDEAARLQLSHYNGRTHEAHVLGKGKRARTVYFEDAGARRALNAWLRVRGNSTGPFLAPVTKAGRVLVGRSISGQAIFSRLRVRAAQAGLAPFSPHDLRRSFASALFSEGADSSLVRELLGHSSIATTQKYDLRSEKAKKRAARRVRVPFRPPRRV